MYYHNINNPSDKVTLKAAVMQSPTDINGLYMPEMVPSVNASFIKNIHGLNLQEIAFEVAKIMFKNDVPAEELEKIIYDALSFDIPLVPVDDGISSLELFHGPTMAFKDVGARFMAGLFEYFMGQESQEVNILVATSGDTGSAVASAFLNKPGIKVTILYPSGKVSPLQEKQLTTLENNITALEVKGNFDDCQRMAKQAFADSKLKKHVNLTSANSINFARLFPQSFYYFYAYSQVKEQEKPIVFCVPSGNFGNITAGLLAKRMGLPVQHFIAATNCNDVVPHYLKTGDFIPKPSIATISNAMDVGNPSNFNRMLALYKDELNALKDDVTGYSYNDRETREIMKTVYKKFNYVLDPHGAIAYGALKHYKEANNVTGIFLETAHPAKFSDVVEETLQMNIPIPAPLREHLSRTKNSIIIENDYEVLQEFLLS